MNGSGSSDRPQPPGPAAYAGYSAPSEHIRNIPLDIILTLLTLYLYNVIWWQHKQMRAVNAMLGQEKYSWGMWALLSLVTCGIYHVYHEYRKSEDIARVLGRGGSNDGIVNLLLTLFGLGVIADAIQQARINEHFGSSAL